MTEDEYAQAKARAAKKQAMEDAKARGYARAVTTMANAAEAYASSVQTGPDASARLNGPKTLGKQLPVPAHASPYAGLKCSKCGSRDVAGFVVSGKFKLPTAPQTLQEKTDSIERHLADAVYGSVSAQDIALVTEFGLPLEHLQPGLVGREKPVGSQVPVAVGVPVCLRHLNEALATVPEVPKPSEPLCLADLSHDSHWRLLPGSDMLFCTVVDKHGTEARIRPADYKAHTGVWPGSA